MRGRCSRCYRESPALPGWLLPVWRLLHRHARDWLEVEKL